MIETKQTTITPELADEWLQKHYARVDAGKFRQRSVSPKMVERFAADMRCDNWELSPDPITYDTNGDLINGQHRLEAIKKSGKTVEVMVSRGWPAGTKAIGKVSTIDCIDRGRPRSIANQLAMHGTTHTTAVAASVAACIRILTGGTNVPLGYATVVHILDKLGLRKQIDGIINLMPGHPNGRIVGPLAWYRTYNRAKADEFARRLTDMDFIIGSPPWLFARYRRDAQHQNQALHIRALCSCLRAWDKDETIAHVKATSGACLWLANKNPKLAEQISKVVRLGHFSVDDEEASAEAEPAAAKK